MSKIKSCIGFLLPYIGLFGYYNEIWWLFYITGGLCLLMDIIALINGQLRCWGSIVTIVFWIVGYRYVNEFWSGLIWGTCISTLILEIYAFILSAFMIGIGGIVVVWDWIKHFFGKDKTDDSE